MLVLRARDERLDRGEVREAVDGPRQAVDPGGDGAHAQLRAERVAEVAAVPREQRVRVALPERDEPREPPLDGARVEAAAAHGHAAPVRRAVGVEGVVREDARPPVAVAVAVLDARELDARVEDAAVPGAEEPLVERNHRLRHVDAHADVRDVVDVDVDAGPGEGAAPGLRRRAPGELGLPAAVDAHVVLDVCLHSSCPGPRLWQLLGQQLHARFGTRWLDSFATRGCRELTPTCAAVAPG